MERAHSRTDFNSRQWLAVAVAWALVGIPLLWGVIQTVRKAALLFK